MNLTHAPGRYMGQEIHLMHSIWFISQARRQIMKKPCTPDVTQKSFSSSSSSKSSSKSSSSSSQSSSSSNGGIGKTSDSLSLIGTPYKFIARRGMSTV